MYPGSRVADEHAGNCHLPQREQKKYRGICSNAWQELSRADMRRVKDVRAISTAACAAP